MQGMLSKEEFEELEKKALQKVVEEDKSLVTCKCGNVMELVKGNLKESQ